MKKLWKGMFMTPHLWESIYMAHRAGYDGCGAMILPRGGKGPLHELLAEPGLWSRVQTALDETGLYLEFVAWGICDDLQKAKDLLKMVGWSNARIALDIMHLYYSSVTPEEIAACPPELFGEFHLCDVPHITFPDGHRELAAEGRSYRLWPGESGLDLTKWLEVIPDTAVIMPEIPNQDRNALYGQFEYNCRTLEECKRYYRAHGISL